MRLTAAALLSLLAAPACAQVCLSPEDVTKHLKATWHEDVVFFGEAQANDRAQDGGVLLIYGNPDQSTWTAVLLKPGCAILLMGGSAWQAIAVVPGEDG